MNLLNQTDTALLDLSKIGDRYAFAGVYDRYCSLYRTAFTSPDASEDWTLYHANPQSPQGCEDNRSVRMQKFSWKPDDTPDFGRPAALDFSLDKPSVEIE